MRSCGALWPAHMVYTMPPIPFYFVSRSSIHSFRAGRVYVSCETNSRLACVRWRRGSAARDCAVVPSVGWLNAWVTPAF